MLRNIFNASPKTRFFFTCYKNKSNIKQVLTYEIHFEIVSIVSFPPRKSRGPYHRTTGVSGCKDSKRMHCQLRISQIKEIRIAEYLALSVSQDLSPVEFLHREVFSKVT